MIRQKKEIKRILFVSIFIITIFLSNIEILNNFIVFHKDKINNPADENPFEDLPQISITDVDGNFTGSGLNQDVRVYTNNKSRNYLNNEQYFEIPSLPTVDMYLSSGNFSFNFQNNFTTDYIIEDDDALYADDFISFDYDSGFSGITFTNGTPSEPWSFGSLTDGNNGTYIAVVASTGLLNFTVTADFTGTEYTSGVINGNVEFDRSKILGFISSLIFRIMSDKNANLTVRIKNYEQSSWKDVISNLLINGSLGRQELRQHIINENLNFIDPAEICYIQFIFDRYDQTSFTTRLIGYDMRATYAFDLVITNQSYVALEFDLKGEESALNGFYVWIRTLNISAAATTQLNITLYRANRTVVRTDFNLRNIYLGPDYNDQIDSFIVSNYDGDILSYFPFDTSKTGKLNLSNYFIVIKSNNPNEVYSLVTLPWFDYGDDQETEHQLKTTIDDGNNWVNAKKVVISDFRPYESGQLDASSFKLNVTRGYMPSDFAINGNYTLRIQDIPLENFANKTAPYNESSYLTWGLGRWNHSFTTPITEPTNVFRVDLTWNKAITKGFKFNLTTYSVNAYWIENALTSYIATYDNDPEWFYTYNLDKNDPLFDDWKFIEFWFVYPNYLSANNVTNPNGEKILPSYLGEDSLTENPAKKRVIIPNYLATLSGDYILNLTSFNFIYDMHSYINYYGKLWESKGFMNGDNISFSVSIQDPFQNAPNNGDVNVVLFYPDGTKFDEVNSSTGFIDGSKLIYDFNNQTILNVTTALTTFGEYHLGFFWFNNSAIGCKKITIYIDLYDIELYNLEYNTFLNKNILDGEIINRVFNNYTMLVASINETTGLSIPNFYPINNSDLNELFSYDVDGQELQLMLKSFLQSENILNPSETVNIKLTLQNLHSYLPIDVIVDVKLVSYINDEWIIAENTSNPVELYFSGHPNDTFEFELDLTIPDLDILTKIWHGVNAPIRLGGAKTIVTIYIDDPIKMAEYVIPDYSLLSNVTSNNFEGHILGMRVAEETESITIIYDFKRNECIYYPNMSKFLVNIIDRNYISSYNQFIDEFSLNLNSKFTEIDINPSIPFKGQTFNLSTILKTEFGVELPGRNVTCQYYDVDTWINISSDITDINGSASFLINTQTLDFDEDLLLKLLWDGDSINGVERNVTVEIIHPANNLSISILLRDVFIYRGEDTSFLIRLNNIGNSDLRILNITLEFNRELDYSIVEINYLLLNLFPAGEGTSLIVVVSVPNIRTLTVTISITAQNIITNESIIVSEEVTYKTYEPPIYLFLIEYFMFIMISAFALIWLVTILMARRTKKRIETPITKEEAKKPRKAKYVPVTELKKPTTVKKVVKKKEEAKKIEEKEKTDLDSLLEERGLSDRDKKSKD
ncbi:MAG: hypothetical protein JSV62_07690 [Promethearchaeota archaeon]|nr:MAG: hypothetical protein JSV62_07690 [Candidatus Lokiarchaeota archaeon]